VRAIRFQAQAQGDSAFDPGAAVLKAQGTSEFDRLTEEIAKRNVHVGSIIVIGHTDKLEAERFEASLSEDRAKAVVAYLASKGMDPALMFWEGKGASDPLPVTRFCD
jgi:OOP family OmpA-OmpF porin